MLKLRPGTQKHVFVTYPDLVKPTRLNKETLKMKRSHNTSKAERINILYASQRGLVFSKTNKIVSVNSTAENSNIWSNDSGL